MGETLACTRGGGGRAGWGGVVRMGRDWHGRRACVWQGKWGILTSADTAAQVWLKILFTSQSSYFTFISGLWRIIKNNTSCCECTSNNQTLIVLLCCNVQSKYLYIYSVKQMTGGKIKSFQPTPETRTWGEKKVIRSCCDHKKPPPPPFCSIILR